MTELILSHEPRYLVTYVGDLGTESPTRSPTRAATRRPEHLEHMKNLEHLERPPAHPRPAARKRARAAHNAGIRLRCYIETCTQHT